MTALSADEVAARFGRKREYIYRHWRDMVAKKQLPPPLLGGTPPLSWDAAHVAAFLDRDLRPAERVAAAAYRAAADAVQAAIAPGARGRLDDADEIAAARARLDARLAG